MADTIISGQTTTKEDYTQKPLPKAEYEQCIFEGCNFGNTNLRGVKFIECTFTDCNFSNADVRDTAFRGANFGFCKMLGVAFNLCSTMGFAVSFNDCNLTLVQFYKLNLKGTVFTDCKLTEVDFSNTNLMGATFGNCDLNLAKFSETNLSGANLSTAFNYTININNNTIKKAIFAVSGLPGLLDGYGIKVVLG